MEQDGLPPCAQSQRFQSQRVCYTEFTGWHAWHTGPGAWWRSSASLWEAGTKRMQPFSTVASETASQQVAVAVSAVKGGQYAMSWCLQHAATLRSAADAVYGCVRSSVCSCPPRAEPLYAS